MGFAATLSNRPRNYWLWAGACGAAAIVWLALLGILFASGQSVQQALDVGQRVEFDFATGMVTGKHVDVAGSQAQAPELPPALPAETPPAPQTPAVAPAPETSAAPATPETPLMPAARIPPQENPEVSVAELAPPAIPLVQSTKTLGERIQEALAPADSKMTEKAEDGSMLPIVAKDGTRASQYYARPFEHQGSAPVIAVVITGLGYSRSLTESATNLPGTFSLAFSSYAPNLETWVKSARQYGHESWIELAMEPPDYPASDPGPLAIFAEMQPAETTRRLHMVISKFQGLVGVITPPNEVVTSTSKVVSQVMDDLKKRGLIAIVTEHSENTEQAEALKFSKGTAFLADATIDENMNAATMQKTLAQVEATAQERGYALLTVKATPGSLQALSQWEPTLRAKEIQLAPATAIQTLAH